MARRASARAKAAAKRKKRLALVGGVLFLGVLAIQLPTTLKLLRGSAEGEAVPAAPVPARVGPEPAPAPVASEPARGPAASLARFVSKDPFIPGGSGRPPDTAVSRPAVRRSKDRDPFLEPGARGRAATEPDDSLGPVELRPARPGSKYTVVLASIPHAAGRGSAAVVARRAKRAGLGGVGVLDSSTYSSLRSGYYVIFNGTFKRPQAAVLAARAARARGFANAYARELSS